MGFLENLQDIGFGNRGPYGRMMSGATNYANYFQQKLGVESNRGISQALAMASKDGQPIDMKFMAGLSDKWQVPLPEIMERAKPINEKNRSTRVKHQLHTMAQIYMKKKKVDPTWKPTEKDLMQIASDAEVTDMEVIGMAKDAIIKLRDESQVIGTKPGEKLSKLTTSIGGQTTAEPVLEHPAKPETPKETPAERLRRAKELAEYKHGLTEDSSKENEGIPKTAKQLRDEFTKQSKVFVSVRNAYNRVVASAEDPSPAGDLSMIFNYMKILDPGSVVRESEFATAANSGSVPSRIIAQYNKVLRGERLDIKMRADFLNRSKQLYKKQVDTHKQLRSEYTRLAKEYKFNPSLAIVNYLAPEDVIKLKPEEQTEAQKLRQRYGLEDTN